MMLARRESITLGAHWSYNLLNDPKRLGFVLARYGLAEQMIRGCRRVLELGCSEGIGVPMLVQGREAYLGVDMDPDAILAAKANWIAPRVAFTEADFLGRAFGEFDAVVSLDVVEHIAASSENAFFETLHANLDQRGVAVVGTPNVTAARYASAASNAGHINLFDADRLRETMNHWFNVVMVLGINDEVMHFGYAPMAHYLIAVGYSRKEQVQL